MELITRFFNSPKQSFFLFGPRGTGKTWWLKEQYPNALYIDLLQPDVYRSYTSRPERFRDLIKANRNLKTVPSFNRNISELLNLSNKIILMPLFV